MAEKKEQRRYGSGLTQLAADLYTAEDAERYRGSSIENLIGTGLDLVGKYYQLNALTRDAFLESFDPDTYNVELLPKEVKGGYVDFAQDLKNVVSENSALAGKYAANPTSAQYKDAVKNIEDAKGALQDVYEGFTDYQNLRKTLLSNPYGIMTGDPVKDNIYNTIISEKGYERLVPTKDGLMYQDLAQNGKLIPIKELGTPDFLDPNLGQDVNNSLLVSSYELGFNGGYTDDIANGIIKTQVRNITNDPAKVKQIMFYGFDTDNEETRYADYYIMEQAILGNPGYSEVTFTDGEGNVLQAKDLDTNGDGELSVAEKSGYVINQEAFDAKLNQLRTSTDREVIMDYTNRMIDFLTDMSVEQYNSGKMNKVTGEDPIEDPTRTMENEFKRGLRRTSREIQALYDENSNKGSFTYNFGPKGNKVGPGVKPGSVIYSIPTDVAGEFEVREYDSYDDWWASESGWPDPRKYTQR